MNSLQSEISQPEISAETFSIPAILWRGDHSMLDMMCGRSRLQVGPFRRLDGVDVPANAAESPSAPPA
jgi:hypothetical protein